MRQVAGDERAVATAQPAATSASRLRRASSPPVDPQAAVLAERVLSLVRTGSYTSVNGIVQALAARGHGVRRKDVYAAVTAMLADGRLSRTNELFRAADP